MKNYLIVTMPDQSCWRIPVRFIAEHRARYYAARFTVDYQDIFDDEVGFCLADDYELEDWASNNMNWVDVAPVAERLPDEPVGCDYERAWGNADKTIQAMLDTDEEVQDVRCGDRGAVDPAAARC